MPEKDGLREQEERKNSNGSGRLLLWAGQLVAALIIPLIWEGYLESALGWSQYDGVPFGAVGTQMAAAGAIALCSVAVAYLFSIVSSKACRLGTWVWVLPLASLTIAILWQKTSLDWTAIGNEFFFWSHPGLDEGIMMRDFFTYPAWSASCFSTAAAIILFARHKVTLRSKGGDRPTAPHLAG